MKHLFLHIILFFLVAFSAVGQNDYRPVKVDVGVLLGEVNHHNVGLVAPYLEPKYNINNQWSVGMRMEYVFYSKDDFIEYNPNDPYLSDFDADGWTFSMVGTTDYYFNNNFVRPFVGVGAGVFYLHNEKENSYLAFDEQIMAFGYVPRAGFNIGQFRLACEYNVIMSEKVNLNYVSLKVGYEIGGQKKWF